jgi:hypothetical protein
MSADWAPQNNLKILAIEFKARRYRDPIQKLAYLQRVAKKVASRRRPHSSLFSVPVLLLALFGVSRVQTVTDVNAGLPHEKSTVVNKLPDVHTGLSPLGTAWLVENGPGYEVYSNGLRIENRYLTPNAPRSYVVFRNGLPSERYSKLAGIIFHTSESVQAPFEPDQKDSLTRIGKELLEFVSRRKAYHFVIDRFGRVFRIVPESDSANHAGYSVWADRNGVYVNLNHSFLGLSFEAQTRDLDQGSYLSTSQIHSGRSLVEMLVSK